MSFGTRDFMVGPEDSLWGKESPLPGIDIQLLAGSHHTEGQYSLCRQTISQDVYPHIHHNEDESIYLLDGEITVTIGDKPYDLTPGSFLFMPRDVPHAIKSHTTWTGLSVSAPAVHFQACMEELLDWSRSGKELTMAAMMEIQKRHGIEDVSAEGSWYDL